MSLKIWVMQQNTNTHTCKNHIYHSQNKLSNQGPSQLCLSTRNAEKEENILITSCFLTAAGRGQSYLVMLSICFYSMRTCDVSELVSPFPLQHVLWCQEKSMSACWPRKIKLQGRHEDVVRGTYSMHCLNCLNLL